MQPTPPTPPTAFEPVIDLFRAQRQSVATALLVLAVLFLATTAWLGVRSGAFSSSAPETRDKDAKDKGEDPFRATKPDATAAQKDKQVDYIVGAGAAFLACLACAAVGAFLYAKPPRPTEAEDRTQARQVVLVLGALLGAALILAGALFFYQWSGSLLKWLDQGEFDQAQWVMIPLLMVVTGGALMFVSAQPARADERNSARVRQFIYGSNFGLTVLLLLVVLVVANAVVALRVQNKLDTTASATYTLSDQTRQLLQSLDQPVHAYAIFQDGADLLTQDARRLLQNCEETSQGKFRVTFLSPALNRTEITRLRADFPMAELSGEGILLVAGEEGGDRKRHAFIRDDELGTADPDGRGLKSFSGEPKLLRELVFLAENKQKPKVYFTQSSGELAVGAGRGDGPRRSASILKGYLEKNYFDVAELTFGLGKPAKVPDDAAVVVVADPTAALPPDGVEAIRRFMTDPRPDGKKGKLVVLAGQQPGPDQRPLKLGLEPLLETFGVRFSDRFLYTAPSERADPRDPDQGARVTVATISAEAVQARNPVAVAFAQNAPRLMLMDCREVASAPGAPGGAQPVRLLSTLNGLPTWAPPTYAPRPVETWNALNKRVEAVLNSAAPDAEKERLLAAVRDEVMYSERPRPLAVFVTEPGAATGPATARVAVFGCGWLASDDAAGRANQGQSTTVWLDLIGSTLDWIRDRPAVQGATDKPYTKYELKPGYDSFRMLWLPLALSVLLVTGFGAGVWVIRRK